MKKLIAATLVLALLASVGIQAAWASPPAADPIIHIVQWGENLTSIAWKYGTTISAIVQANNIANQNWVYAGQRLVIPVYTPSPAPSGSAYVVRSGDTLTGIAYKYGVTINALVSANHIVNPHQIYPGQKLVIPGWYPAPSPVSSGDTYYTVVRGDTLAKIAVRFGVSIWSIVQANNIANPNVIEVGQQLYIPKAGSVSSESTISSESESTVSSESALGCDNLTSPKPDDKLSGLVEVKGTANLDSFWYYKLEFHKDSLDDWHYIAGAEEVVENGTLGTWNTWTVSDGTYLFRLVVVDRMGNYPPPCEIPVRVSNHP
jgi:LysM repeat protein